MLADFLAGSWRVGRFRRQGAALVSQAIVDREPVLLVKPQTYMNLSGGALEPLLATPLFEPAKDLLVLVDDFAIPLGQYRIRASGSAGGHNGLESIQDAVGSSNYPRIRVGVGPLPSGTSDWSEFVLGPFDRQELDTLRADVFPPLKEAVECWLAEGIVQAMNRFNRKGRGEEPDAEP